MAKEIKIVSQILGCPSCIIRAKKKAVPEALVKRGIKRVIVEKKLSVLSLRTVGETGKHYSDSRGSGRYCRLCGFFPRFGIGSASDPPDCSIGRPKPTP